MYAGLDEYKVGHILFNNERFKERKVGEMEGKRTLDDPYYKSKDYLQRKAKTRERLVKISETMKDFETFLSTEIFNLDDAIEIFIENTEKAVKQMRSLGGELNNIAIRIRPLTDFSTLANKLIEHISIQFLEGSGYYNSLLKDIIPIESIPIPLKKWLMREPMGFEMMTIDRYTKLINYIVEKWTLIIHD